MKSLIVEDDSVSRFILDTTLRVYGPTTLLFNGSGAAARVLQALDEGVPFDLITLDIMMPEVDGQTALRQIREAERSFGVSQDSRSRIVMTTALDDQKNVFAARQGACDGYLVKPIRKGALLTLVRQLGLIP